jgi:hypothetical protein
MNVDIMLMMHLFNKIFPLTHLAVVSTAENLLLLSRMQLSHIRYNNLPNFNSIINFILPTAASCQDQVPTYLNDTLPKLFNDLVMHKINNQVASGNDCTVSFKRVVRRQWYTSHDSRYVLCFSEFIFYAPGRCACPAPRVPEKQISLFRDVQQYNRRAKPSLVFCCSFPPSFVLISALEIFTP